MKHSPPPAREPMLNAPWQAVAIPAVLAAVFVMQLALPQPQALILGGLSEAGLRTGGYYTLISHLFVHGGWAHLIMNSLAALAFGPPVARHFGASPRAVAAFFAFFLVLGVLSGLAYLAVHLGRPGLLVGASGAISGFWGAASRLLGGQGRLRPITNRAVLSQAVAFVLLNLIVGLLSPLIDLYIAWEAHIAGYVCGLALMGLFTRLAGR